MTMRVILEFWLDEDVTPAIFASKVAQACSSGALRPGESVVEPFSGTRYIISEKMLLDEPAFDFLKQAGKKRETSMPSRDHPDAEGNIAPDVRGPRKGEG